MTKFFAPAFSFLCLAGISIASAQNVTEESNEAVLSGVLMDKSEGCLQGALEQFGRYLGDWNIQDWQRDADGNWVEQKGARWNFVCVGDGIAIQDFWMPNTGGVGTNLRMYNPASESWDIAWTASGLPGFTHINAKEDDEGNIVMHYVSPPQNPARRITFFAPTEDGWDWVLEISTDNEKTWTPVYKIKATLR